MTWKWKISHWWRRGEPKTAPQENGLQKSHCTLEPPPPPLAPSCANRARDNFDFEAPSTNAKEVAVYACEPLKDHWRIIAWDFKLLIPIPPLLRNSWFDSKYVWGVAQPFAKLLHEIIIRKRNVMAHHQMLSPSRAHQANLARNPNY